MRFLWVILILFIAVSCGKNKSPVESETMKNEASNTESKEGTPGANDADKNESSMNEEELKAVLTPLIKKIT